MPSVSRGKTGNSAGLSDEELTKLFSSETEPPLRSSTGSLEYWHWGKLNKTAEREPKRLQRQKKGAVASPSGGVSRPDFGRAAVLQSSAWLPESETAGISPARGLGTSIHNSPLSAAFRRTPVNRISQASSKPSAVGWASPTDPHSAGSRAFFRQIMRRRRGSLPSSVLSSPMQTAANPLQQHLYTSDALERYRKHGTPKRDIAAFPVSVEASPDGSIETEAPLGSRANLAAGSDSNCSSRPWSWSWAWTPPSIPATPEERRDTDLTRLAAKFSTSSLAISGNKEMAGQVAKSLHSSKKGSAALRVAGRIPAPIEGRTNQITGDKFEFPASGETSLLEAASPMHEPAEEGPSSPSISTVPELVRDESPTKRTARRRTPPPLEGSRSANADIDTFHRKGSDTPSFRDGVAPRPERAVHRNIDLQQGSGHDASLVSPLRHRQQRPCSLSLSASAEFRDADLVRGRTLSMGGSTGSPIRSPAPKSTGPDQAAREGFGQEGDGQDLQSTKQVSPKSSRTGSVPSPGALASSRRPGRLVLDPVQALWDSCKKAAAAARPQDNPQATSYSGLGSARSVRCSLLESMNSAAEDEKSDQAQSRQLQPPVETGSADVSKASNPSDPHKPVNRVDCGNDESSALKKQLDEANRERSALRAQVAALQRSPTLYINNLACASQSPASSIASCRRPELQAETLQEQHSQNRRQYSGAAAHLEVQHRKVQRGCQAENRGDENCSSASNSGSPRKKPDKLGTDHNQCTLGNTDRKQTSSSPNSGTEELFTDAGAVLHSNRSSPRGSLTQTQHSLSSYEVWAQQNEAPISKEDWTRQRLWWRARVRAAEGEASRLKQRIERLEAGTLLDVLSDERNQLRSVEGAKAEVLSLEQQLNAKDWLLAQLQEQMQESEEHYSRLLHEEHSRLADCEAQFMTAMREAEAQLAESALVEEHLINELHYAQHEIEELRAQAEDLFQELNIAKESAARQEQHFGSRDSIAR